MICDRCGKSNIRELKECAYCGARMPDTVAQSGFSDILNVNVEGNPQPNKSNAVDEQKLRELTEKMNALSLRINKSVSICFVAIVVCALVLISSLLLGASTIHLSNTLKEEQKQISNVKKESQEFDSKLDGVIADVKKIEKATSADINISDNDEFVTQLKALAKSIDELEAELKEQKAQIETIEAEIEAIGDSDNIGGNEYKDAFDEINDKIESINKELQEQKAIAESIIDKNGNDTPAVEEEPEKSNPSEHNDESKPDSSDK